MHVAVNATELYLRSSVPRRVTLSLTITAMLGVLYAYRCYLAEVPPQDHVALSLLLCLMLLNSWRMLDTVHIRFSLAYDRCWVKRTRYGQAHEHSVPLSQIHSARFEIGPGLGDSATAYRASINLITSMGVIPVVEQLEYDGSSIRELCAQINDFLASKDNYLAA